MLVLSRKLHEAIVINDTVRVTVVRVQGDRVRLGIEAPADVTVDRGEVHARKVQFIDVPLASPVCDDSVDLGEPFVVTADDTNRH